MIQQQTGPCLGGGLGGGGPQCGLKQGPLEGGGPNPGLGGGGPKPGLGGGGPKPSPGGLWWWCIFLYLY